MAPFFANLERLSARFLKTDSRYLLYSGFWSMASSIAISLLSLALYFVFANFLTKEAYGTYQYLLSMGALVGSLTFTGMNAAVAQAVARGNEGTLRQAVRLQLTYAFVPLLAALAGAAYYLLNDNAVLATGFALIGFGVPLMNAYNTYSAYLHGKKDFRRGFLYNLFINLPYYGALIGIALVSDSPLLLLGANLIVQAVGYYCAYRVTVRTFKPNQDVSTESLSLGTHLSAMGIIGTVATQADAILAFHFLGAAGLAVYSFATGIPDRVANLLKFLPAAALPQFAHRDAAAVQSGLRARYLIVFGSLLIAVIGYALIAPYLYLFLFPAYVDAIGYSQWYAIVLFGILTQILLAALTAHGRVRSLYLFNVVIPVAQVASVFIGVVMYGLAGLIGARIAITLLSLALASYLVITHTFTDAGENR